jgi:ppGpp synthetase/RelA/SpoT-type nucleotidyltranferase
MEFDFNKHKLEAVEKYIRERPNYVKFAATLKDILEKVLKEKRIHIHSVESRAKEIESFGNKAAKPNEKNPSKPKYSNPNEEITDLAGVRVITFFPKTVDQIDKIIRNQFNVIEKIDKSEI